MVKTHPQVAARLVEKVSQTGVSSVSQYVADALAIHVGLAEYVRELHQATLTAAGARGIEPLRGERIMIRPHHQVSARLAREAADAGFDPQRWSPYIADVLALHVGLPEHVRSISEQEVPRLPTSA